jgi:glucosamine-6-phosphate deaminase
MKIIVKETAEAFDKEGALLFTRQAIKKPDTTFGIATGETTKNIYHLVTMLHKELNVDYSRCKTCNLDEYIGLAGVDQRSCKYRINEGLLNKINIKPENIYIPDGLCDPPERELDIFREKVEQFGGLDFLILGIGINGHIGFNEPGTPFDSGFRIAPLSEKTRTEKAVFFGGGERMPTHGISMGIRDIMMAKEILLAAKGPSKAEAISRIVKGPMADNVPATVVRVHPNLTILIDKDAASLL